mgnify:CR=1 FL=1
MSRFSGNLVRTLATCLATASVNLSAQNLAGNAPGSPVPASEGLPFDWSQPKLIPVSVSVQTGGAQLTAGGQTIGFAGDLIRLDTDGECESKWSVAQREFTTFSLNVTASSPALLRRVR